MKSSAIAYVPQPWRVQECDGQTFGPMKVSPVQVDFSEAAGITTMMIRNLPRNVTLTNLVRDMDETGFAGVYDFLYMPVKFGSGRNHGFAFVNFHSTVMAREFKREWNQSQRLGLRGRDTISITEAIVQGFHANTAKWGAEFEKANRIKNQDWRPLIFRKISPDASQTLSAEASAITARHCGSAALASPARAAGSSIIGACEYQVGVAELFEDV